MEDTVYETTSIFYTLMYFSRFLLRAFLIALLCLMIGFSLIFLVYFGDLFINFTMGNQKTPLFGAYVIASPSMAPTIDTKDAIVIKRVDHDNYDIGDIITFAAADSKLVTHRIVDKESIGIESSTYITKGDNNLVEDSSSVSTSSIYGKVLFRVPKIGYIQDFFAKPSNYFICILIPAILFVIYEVIRIFVLLKQKKAY
jgi:signal peptidase I